MPKIFYDTNWSEKTNPEELFKFVRKEYLSNIEKINTSKKFIIDKMPFNFFAIGFILNSMPEAKIIHTKRNPGATCWSNFTKYFQSDGLGYAYNLKTIVEFYSMYSDLMSFWGKVLPYEIYHLDYENITLNPEKEIYRLIKFLGLSWEKQCLNPNKNGRMVKTASSFQVREKIYKGSSQKWLNYRPFINGLFDNLA